MWNPVNVKRMAINSDVTLVHFNSLPTIYIPNPNIKNVMTYPKLNEKGNGRNLKSKMFMSENVPISASARIGKPVPIRSVQMGNWLFFKDSDKKYLNGRLK
jgi:hypothetical protein